MNRRNPPAKWVLPAVVNPAGRRCFIIEVPDERMHIAAFRGALLNLASAYKWQDDPDHTARDVANVWKEIVANVRTCPPDCEPDLGGTTLEDLMSQQIRISPDDSCIIQMWCIDHWEDWYDPRACIAEGSTQPEPGGELDPDECRLFNATLPGNSQYLLPIPVEEGYTLTITNARGGTSYDAGVNWRCPNGQSYALGACSGSNSDAGGGFPKPDEPVGRLIALIDGVWYDAYNTVIHVPAGVSSGDVLFQVNDDDIFDNTGSLSFVVEVCNAGTQYESFTFDTSDTDYTTTFSTVADASYRVRIVGEVCHNPGDSDDRHDANYSTGDNWATNLGRVIFGGGPLYYGVLLDGFNLPLLPYNASHDYTFTVTGTGAPFVFKPVVNSPYASCGGSFAITVEQL